MELAEPVTGQATPQWLDSEPSALCTIGRPPLVITGALLWIMRRHFADPAMIVDPDLKERVWNTDVTASGIVIEPVTKWPGSPTEAVQQRPAIYVKRNKYQQVKLGIGDRYQLGIKTSIDKRNLSSDNAIDTGVRYGAAIVGSHTLFCLGGTGAEAESVGTEVFFELMEFGQLIRRDLGLSKFQVMDLGGVAKLEESREHWVIPAVVTYAFRHNWTLNPDLPWFKTVSINNAT